MTSTDRFERANRYCDLVMKGGVTSGVVYPAAIVRLAETFIFRNVAGTSVGAIATALCAAAEYDRRFHGSGRGFERFAGLPAFLKTKVAGKTNLIRQFWADTPGMRRQLDAALKLVGDAPPGQRGLRFEAQLALWYWWVWALPTALMLTIADPAAAGRWRPVRLAAAALLGLGAGAAALPLVYARRVSGSVAANDFGWCHGHDPANDDRPAPAESPLCDWLADAIDDLAGLAARTKPLTFGDLARTDVRFGPDDGTPAIVARMMTTCLTLQQPFSLPFDAAIAPGRGGALAFWWSPDDFVRFFPRYVMQHLEATCEPHPQLPAFRRFPAAGDLPLVVAARMSLSFPLLLSAVPLYAFGADGRPARVWFSDGGLTSNLPIHFFDSPIPRWPTFALDLLGVDANDTASARIFIESTEPSDRIDPWERLERNGRNDVVAFVNAILDTTRTWRDRVLARLPGYADRTIGIRLAADEGGLNLNMDEQRIRKLASYGTTAADTLLAAFAPNDGERDAPFWRGHRWTRYAAAMAAHARWTEGFARAFAGLPSAPWQTSYDELIRSAVGTPPGTPSASPPESAAGAFPTATHAGQAADRTATIAGSARFDSGLFAEIPPHPQADIGPKPPY